MLILPAHFLMWCVIPSLFFIGVVSLVVSSFLAPLAVVGFWIVAILLLAASQQSRSFLVSFVQSQYALVMGLFRLAKRRESLLIQTIPSTRENV